MFFSHIIQVTGEIPAVIVADRTGERNRVGKRTKFFSAAPHCEHLVLDRADAAEKSHELTNPLRCKDASCASCLRGRRLRKSMNRDADHSDRSASGPVP
jgi:hypothetical protein